MIFKRLEHFNLKVKPSKTKIAMKKIKLLGLIVSEKRLGLPPERIDVIKRILTPRTRRQIVIHRSSELRDFIEDMSELAKPLYDLSNCDHWLWTEECYHAFNEIKRRITCTPILTIPEERKQKIIFCYASDYAIGGVIFQEGNNDKLHVIRIFFKIVVKE